MSIFSKANVVAIASAMYGVIGQTVKERQAYADIEASRLTHGLDLIHAMSGAGTISEETAAAQVDALLESGRLFFKTNKEISGLKAKLAVAKGLEVAAGIFNAAIGFPLIPVNG
ncbi:hypothetical protein [Sphingomonas sp. Ant20]|uniref:hypothetical protein n=1 Tax=Sphingomonas sp. Ant20 TaxID=104605 RepID=UPI000FE140A9|nr:hypothetical protein [Sphingomonas sp. Ant20]